MKLFVSTNWPPDYQFGGVVYSGQYLFESLHRIDTEWKAVATGTNDSFGDITSIFKFSFNGRYGISLSAIIYLFKIISRKKVSFVFINGTVTWITMFSQLFCYLYGVKYIVSTRGALEPWRMSYKKIKKQQYFNFLVLPLLKKSTAIHVTGILEHSYVSKLVNNKIIISPNGSNNFVYLQNENVGLVKCLFLSRISPEKGLDILDLIIDKIYLGLLNIELSIVGPGASNRFNIKHKSIKILDAVYGDEKIKLFKDSDFFLLPSYSENFGNVVLESLSYGRPVLTTSATPWEQINGKYGWIVEPNKDSVLQELFKLSKLDRNSFINMGRNAADYAYDNFTWEVIAKKLNKELYEI
jgi:glycosyltransferase involved in cell wall biosynthesis